LGWDTELLANVSLIAAQEEWLEQCDEFLPASWVTVYLTHKEFPVVRLEPVRAANKREELRQVVREAWTHWDDADCPATDGAEHVHHLARLLATFGIVYLMQHHTPQVQFGQQRQYMKMSGARAPPFRLVPSNKYAMANRRRTRGGPRSSAANWRCGGLRGHSARRCP
jgi:hypothetical protein